MCQVHGGRAPQVVHAAMERLKALQPKALTVMDSLLDEDNPFVRLATAKDVLDRTGVGKDKSVAGTVLFTLRIDRGDSDD